MCSISFLGKSVWGRAGSASSEPWQLEQSYVSPLSHTCCVLAITSTLYMAIFDLGQWYIALPNHLIT